MKETDALAVAPILRGEQRISGYRLIRQRGRGGVAEVWEAESPGGYRVALKLVHLSTDLRAGELRALKITREVKHPHLLTIFGTWQVDSLLVISMELADRSLWDRFLEARSEGLRGIPRGELLSYLDPVADAIDYLNDFRHAVGDRQGVGIQHRDLKPQNILLFGACAKVADFGMARIMERSVTSHTGPCTLPYAAPEYFGGQTSRQSDQYALAVTYCQLRGGRMPFPGTTAQIAVGHLCNDPDLSGLPEPERPLVARALAKRPEERWPDCRSLLDALRAVEATAACPIPDVLPRRHDPEPLSDEMSGAIGDADTDFVPVDDSDDELAQDVFDSEGNLGLSGRLRAMASWLGVLGRDAYEADRETPATGDRLPAWPRVRQAVAGLAPWGEKLQRGARSIRPRAATFVARLADRGRRSAQWARDGLAESWGRASQYRDVQNSEAFSSLLKLRTWWHDQANRLRNAWAWRARLPRWPQGSERAIRLEALKRWANTAARSCRRLAPQGLGSVRSRVILTGALAAVGFALLVHGQPEASDGSRLARPAAPALAPSRALLASNATRPSVTRVPTVRPLVAPASSRRDERPARPRLVPWITKLMATAARNGWLEPARSAPVATAPDDTMRTVRLRPTLPATRPAAAPAPRSVARAVERPAAAIFERGRSDLARGENDDAMTAFTEAIRLDPKAAQAYLYRGVASQLKGRFRDALTDYTKAIELQPDAADAYAVRARVRREMGENSLALQDYTEVIRIRPEPKAYLARGALLDELGEYERALADDSTALRLRPGDSTAYYQRGLTRYHSGDYSGAIADFTEVIRLDPKHAMAYRYRADAHARLGELTQATADHDAFERLSGFRRKSED